MIRRLLLTVMVLTGIMFGMASPAEATVIVRDRPAPCWAVYRTLLVPEPSIISPGYVRYRVVNVRVSCPVRVNSWRIHARSFSVHP